MMTEKSGEKSGKQGDQQRSGSTDKPDSEVMGDAQLTEQSEKAHSEGGKIDRSKTPGIDYDV